MVLWPGTAFGSCGEGYLRVGLIKPLETLQLADLGVEAADTFKTTQYAAPSKRSKGVMVKDAAELVAALKQKGLL